MFETFILDLLLLVPKHVTVRPYFFQAPMDHYTPYFIQGDFPMFFLICFYYTPYFSQGAPLDEIGY